MSDDIEWGPWIEHDGDPGSIDIPPHDKVGIQCTDDGIQIEGSVGRTCHPCFSWSLRIKSLFPFKRVPVCRNALYAPVLRYRFGWRKSAESQSEAAKQIRAIASDPSTPLVETKEPKRESA